MESAEHTPALRLGPSGAHAASLIFDGALVRHADSIDLEGALRGAEAAVKEKLGYAISLAEKPMYEAGAVGA